MKLDIIAIRDPDAETDVRIFIDGVEYGTAGFPSGIEVNEVHVDPGAGWTLRDWNEARDEYAASVHTRIADMVRAKFNQLAENEHVAPGED